VCCYVLNVRIVRFSLYIEDGEVGSKEYIELCDKRLLYKSSSIKQHEVARQVFRENKRRMEMKNRVAMIR
jgi:hypothetical protein